MKVKWRKINLTDDEATRIAVSENYIDEELSNMLVENGYSGDLSEYHAIYCNDEYLREIYNSILEEY